MRVCVMGTGYVGLVVGPSLASTGNRVVCFDVDPERVRRLQKGEIPISEPGLEELVKQNVDAGRLTFTDDPEEALRDARVVFVAVGTPGGEDGHPDMSQIWSAGEIVGQHMDGATIVVVKSTVPVGTGDRLEEIIAGRTRHAFEVVSNPEFLKEGDALNDFMKPSRVVIGTDSEWARQILHDLYGAFMRLTDRTLFMDRRSAELTKYACNAFLATRISFINEIARLCDKVGADVEHVRQGMGMDPRIGNQFLFPGVGYGGSCFPKDVRALIATGEAYGCPMEIPEAVDRVNQGQRHEFTAKVIDRLGDDLSGRRLAVWGLSFKARTDDIREAPALTVIEGLLERGATVCAFDPAAAARARGYFRGRIDLAYDMYDAVQGADALLVLTDWQEFRHPDFEQMHHLMRHPVILDGRNLYSSELLSEYGFEYHAIGRPFVPPAGNGRQLRLVFDDAMARGA